VRGVRLGGGEEALHTAARVEAAQEARSGAVSSR
jgi:hypothetical protein